MTTDLPIRRALISVSDKTGLLPLAQALAGRGVEILSTGGTARQLREAGIAIREVSEVTAFPEIMDGRVKTLHPRIHGGLLARRDQPHHRAAAEEHGIPMIDLLVVNLYPFEETIAGEAEFAEAIENIDIGGPAMIRAAAKNHAHVAVVTDPDDYEAVIAALEARDGAVDADLRRRLAATAFARTAAYDAAIATWFAGELGEDLGRRYFLAGSRRQALRYGENPHQQAALYVTEPEVAGVARATQVQGKELSYNNLNDTDAAWAIAAEPDRPCAVIVKHANPCGVAEADGLADAYRKALAADPVSAFGGIVALNRPLDRETAAELAKIFTEVIIAPEADAEAREVLSAKQNLRLLITGQPPRAGQHRMDVRTIGGGFLVQSHDIGRVEAADLKVVTERAPSAAEMADLLFAFRIVKHVKSNAILFARHGATLGIGAGQMSRVDSVRLAVEKARQTAEGAAPPCHGSVVASDAFFPFADGLIAAAEAGATAAIHPGGSKRDQEVIDAANERGMAMVVTGMRHFLH